VDKYGSKGIRGRKRKTAGRPRETDGVAAAEHLHESIEIERDNLSKAESVLGCLAIAMEYETDAVNRPYYPDVARIARDMVRRSINGLDPLLLRQRLRNKIEEEAAPTLVGYGQERRYVISACSASANIQGCVLR
jgi:hypothetical protein